MGEETDEDESANEDGQVGESEQADEIEQAGESELGDGGEEADEFESAIEARLQTEFACAEPDAERVAAAVARARAAGDLPDWSPPFVVAKLADAPDERTVREKWNWLLGYVGGDADSDEYRLDG